MPFSLSRRCFLLIVSLILSVPAVARAAEPFVWIEGEKPTACNVKPNTSGWGNSQFLSGEAWLSISIDKEKVDAEVPGDGVQIDYDFDIAEKRNYEIWNRIGFEFVRSPFDWRIDQGPWQRVEPTELTSDLMEIAFWCEVAWLKLGQQPLDTGHHRLTIRLPKLQNEKNEIQRILYASDAVCISGGAFHPNSKYPPDQDGRDQADQKAAEQVFQFPEPESASQRASIPLEGTWEICRDDEQLPGPVDRPIDKLPEHPFWKAIPVPGDKNQLRPDLLFAHRLWYRTRVELPKSCAGRSFFLVFPHNNLNTTVYVNGQYCGFDKNPFARVQIDVSKAMRPGVNEICVGIRDAWYAYSTNPNDPMKLRKRFNLPIKFFSEGFQDLAYPVWHHPESGILITPELVCAGPAYVSDVFCKPSVAEKRLDLEVTVENPTSKNVAGSLLCEVIDNETGEVAKTFRAVSLTLKAGEAKTLNLGETWDDPQLWWPDDPQLYQLRASIQVDKKTVDQSETTFGFRQWSWSGRDFRLNGIVWHGWADCFRTDSPEAWLAFYRKSNQRMMRFWGTRWQELPPEAALDFFDRNGVIVRRSGMLDGEAIGQMAIETDEDLKKLYDSEVKIQLIRNWQDQMIAQVRGERNHPSVMIWSIENEFLYINCINLYGRLMDQFEAEVTKVADAVQKVDPTRPVMVDGGGACKANTLPVQGDHYVFGDFPKYPALAYEANTTGGGRGRWEWDQKRPRFIGEDYFANGINPFDYSYFGGEETFQGKAQSHRAAGIIFRMLTEGYRWAGQGAWQFWLGQNEAENQYNSNAPIAVFCRQWDATFESGQTVPRLLKVFNDSRRNDPIHFQWTLTFDGKTTASGEKTFQIAPGHAEEFSIELPMPQTSDRIEGQWKLELTVGGQTVFEDVKPISVIQTALDKKRYASLAGLGKDGLLVFDPNGKVAEYLASIGLPSTRLETLPEDLPEKYPTAKVLLIGNDAIEPTLADSPRFQAWAQTGLRVVVLDQIHPLCFSAVPTDAVPESNQGRTAFAEDLGHPIFTGLAQKDFFTLPDDELVYDGAYIKPTRGAKSLLQCHNRLSRSALLEVPVDDGLLLLCQTLVGRKIDTSAACRRLLLNMLDYAAGYQLVLRDVVVCTSDLDPQLARALDDIKLRYTEAADPLAALRADKQGVKMPFIAVIPASPGNLRKLATETAMVEQFMQRGGRIVFCGLTPDGLDGYNRLVGVEHLIRPFWRERVTFPVRRHPLTVGLTTGDIVMRSGEQIFGWTKDEYVADDIFTFVVDYDEVGAFAQYPDDFIRNLCNGMVSADAWKYIVNVPTPDEGEQLQWPLRLPRKETIERVEWIGNTFYYPVTRAGLIFDGNEENMFVFDTEPNNDPQYFDLSKPQTGKEITLRLIDWQIVPESRPVTGLDNLKLFAHRSEAFRERVHPMLNVGGLMEYSVGQGGAALCNLRFQANEAVPENRDKKLKILSTILRNLHAPFAEGKTLIAGGNLRYEPVDLSKYCTQFRDEKGWFGDKRFTFAALPVGKQRFAGVPMEIFDFPTSPVPNVVMLRGEGTGNDLPEKVEGIAVGRKADALFLLHAARIDHRRNEREVRENKLYEVFRYVVHYADGRSETIPIHAEIDVDNYRQEEPRILPGATLAWTRPYAEEDQWAVAYLKQWNNPRPDVPIASIDVCYGEERRGTPAVLAITAASAP